MLLFISLIYVFVIYRVLFLNITATYHACLNVYTISNFRLNVLLWGDNIDILYISKSSAAAKAHGCLCKLKRRYDHLKPPVYVQNRLYADKQIT